jgi:hypothetical protein
LGTNFEEEMASLTKEECQLLLPVCAKEVDRLTGWLQKANTQKKAERILERIRGVEGAILKMKEEVDGV